MSDPLDYEELSKLIEEDLKFEFEDRRNEILENWEE